MFETLLIKARLPSNELWSNFFHVMAQSSLDFPKWYMLDKFVPLLFEVKARSSVLLRS